MTHHHHDIETLIHEALGCLASGSWRSLQTLALYAKPWDRTLGSTLLFSLCANPFNDQETCPEHLEVLAGFSPLSACAIALSRSLMALAQEQILTGHRSSSSTTLRQSLTYYSEAVSVAGFYVSSESLDQLLSRVDLLSDSLSSQIDLASAIHRKQLPRQLVLVLGMHRSGTSALSGLLVNSGLEGPADQHAPSIHNPKGYYESLASMQLNDELLNQFNSHWSNADSLPQSCWLPGSLSLASWRHGFLKMLGKSFTPGCIAVLKDPRLCILMPALRPWLESMLIQCTTFLPIRHPVEVAESLYLSESIPRGHGLKLWLRYILESEKYTRLINRLFVPYEELVSDPAAVLSRCYEILPSDSGLDATDIPSELAARNFIDPKLRRQRAGMAAPGWVSNDLSFSVYSLAIHIYSLLTTSDHSLQCFQLEMDNVWKRWRVLCAHPAYSSSEGP